MSEEILGVEREREDELESVGEVLAGKLKLHENVLVEIGTSAGVFGVTFVGVDVID